ncbi:hypothetical protein [Silanimonas sp.]|uniref:hypothetical protein n=1 Tax=Silanimonas sp. TaxID=1929290 RepID=UPI0022BFFB28|nr:hypothetical protein [Silanimonas sp.]MCZ8115899.1 hypothetical protein [Silanimonas sp.]
MPRLSFSGFDRADEAKARALFEGLHLSDWMLSDEAGADAVLIDLDSMYGQMAWMKGFDAGKVTIGLTQALRADTAYRIDAPLSAEALHAVLAAIAGGPQANAPAVETPMPEPAAAAVTSLAPVSPPVATTSPEATAVTAPVPANRLAARLARATGPFAVQFGDLPRLVIDPASQQFAPGKSLKALIDYGHAEIAAESVEALDPETAATALRQAGDPQPLSRLTWLLALGGGAGRLLDHAPGTRFQLGKWPQAEREFPKHFRIATVMLKAPATLTEIASASGASEAEVADYINAALAVGHANAA